MNCAFERAFGVTVRRGLLGDGRNELDEAVEGRRVLCVTTPTVARLYGPALCQRMSMGGVDFRLEVMDLSEQGKSIAVVEEICRAAREHQLGRRDLLIAFGGGVCCDLVTVAASLYRRGIPYLTMPTTLIGQVDAGVGIKGAVNFEGAKSALGCFHPPAGVFVDPDWLCSLPQRHLRSGAAEIVKIALSSSASLFTTMEHNGRELIDHAFVRHTALGDSVVQQAIDLILVELEPNCFEDNTLERVLDLGHCFSVKLEEVHGFDLLHGEAVAIDISLTCEIGVRLGWLSATAARRVDALLVALGLPIDDSELTVPLAIAALDCAANHRDGSVNLPIPTEPGSIRFISDRSMLVSSLAGILDARALRRRAERIPA